MIKITTKAESKIPDSIDEVAFNPAIINLLKNENIYNISGASSINSSVETKDIIGIECTSDNDESDHDSGYDSDCDCSEEEQNYNINEYVIKNYEKDLELAINLSLKDREFCVICFSNPINAVFVPCGHFCSCYFCAKKCKKRCPICRRKCKTIQKIFR